MINIPTADAIINIDKAFMLQCIGQYSAKLKEEIVHSVIPLEGLCLASSSTDVCQFTTFNARINTLEFATILPSRDTVITLPRYDSHQVSYLIQEDVKRIFRIPRTDTAMLKMYSIIHYINNQFHWTNDIENSVLDSTKIPLASNQSSIPRILPTAFARILTQMRNNKIGFDYLTSNQLASFLTAAMSAIDKSYQMEDLSEALNTILQLIVGQFMYIQRSCSINEQPMGTNQPCLIVSTLFLRSSIASDNVFSVYRLKPLPAIVDDEQFMYSNLPAIIGINKDNETVIFWNTVPKKNECLFSIFVHCKTNPPIIISSRVCISCITCTINYLQFDKIQMRYSKSGDYQYTNSRLQIIGLKPPTVYEKLSVYGYKTNLISYEKLAERTVVWYVLPIDLTLVIPSYEGTTRGAKKLFDWGFHGSIGHS
ncbi:unnamed protein product [Didymodactylos carnosus]|uniref:Uncharacterized protein n=1 Tax=Didymodactylos carnosus TaxID=1234261 RepID=A0A815SD34_9BILA|nr:unnamed protein product [Didymodactylos carnosus]CAF4353566.1 unnamed protein product [Didymodactylos carnosus]